VFSSNLENSENKNPSRHLVMGLRLVAGAQARVRSLITDI
jgi:hypothetical protein